MLYLYSSTYLFINVCPQFVLQKHTFACAKFAWAGQTAQYPSPSCVPNCCKNHFDRSLFLDYAILSFWFMLALSMASPQALFTVKRIYVLEEARIFFLSSSRLPVSGMLYTVRTVCTVLYLPVPAQRKEILRERHGRCCNWLEGLEPNKATSKKAWASSNLFSLRYRTVNNVWKIKRTRFEIFIYEGLKFTL